MSNCSLPSNFAAHPDQAAFGRPGYIPPPPPRKCVAETIIVRASAIMRDASSSAAIAWLHPHPHPAVHFEAL